MELWKFGKVGIILLIMSLLIMTVNADPNNNLISYYNMDETSGTTMFDYFGDNNGTITNATINQAGKLDKSHNFNGTTAYTVLQNESNFDFLTANNGTWTISQWIKTTDTAGHLLTKDVWASDTGLRIGLASNTVRLTLFTNGSNYDRWLGSTTIDDDDWHHIVWVNTAGTVKLYVDGSDDSATYSSAGAFTGTTNNNPVVLAGRQGPSGTYAGNLDETAIWNVALSEADVQVLYNGGTGQTYPFSAVSVDANFSWVVTPADKVQLTNTSIDINLTEDDWNWTIDGATTLLSDGNAENPYFSPITEGTDYNACLSVGGLGGDSQRYTDYTCKTINTGRWYADFNITVFDEETGLALDDITIDISDGTNSIQDSFNKSTSLSYNPDLLTILGDTDERIIITVSEGNGNYGTRYYEFDANKWSTNDLNLGFFLLQTGTGRGDIKMKFYDSMGTSINPNIYVEVQQNNNIVSRRKTNNLGETYFYLDESDVNYQFFLEGDYNTQMGSVLINKPLIEETDGNIDANWMVIMSGSTESGTAYKIATDSQLVYIIPNKFQSYQFEICVLADGNIDALTAQCDKTTYESRLYVAMTYGDADGRQETIQPYLSADAEDKKITVRESITEKTLPYATVEVYDTESGEKLITSVQTDAIGVANVYLKSKKYFYHVVDRDGTVREGTTSGRIALWSVSGDDIVIWVGYNSDLVLGESYNVYYGLQNGFSNLGNGAIVDLNTNITATMKIIDANALLRIRVYKNDVEIWSDTKTTSAFDYDYSYTFNTDMNYDSNYQIVFYKNGVEKRRYSLRNLSTVEFTTISSAFLTNNNITFILVLLVLTFAVIMGLLMNKGLETLFILSIIISVISLNSLGVIIAGLLGILYFAAPIIREQFRT